MTSPFKVRKIRSETKDSRWEMATRTVRRALSNSILELNGYSEMSSGPLTRRELPAPQVVVIFEFGPPIRVLDRGGGHGARCFSAGFVAGIDDTFTLTQHAGNQSGIQLNLTPLGARRFFDMPMSELAGKVVSLADILPRNSRSLTERLYDLRSWEERFELIEDFVASRVERSHVPCEVIDWAYRRIVESNGSVPLSELARQLGYSHKHMIALFKDRVGLPPKLLARLVRFDRVMSDLKSASGRSWGDLAARFGYADQSHLVREVRKFTGTTPTRAQELLDGWPAS